METRLVGGHSLTQVKPRAPYAGRVGTRGLSSACRAARRASWARGPGNSRSPAPAPPPSPCRWRATPLRDLALPVEGRGTDDQLTATPHVRQGRHAARAAEVT